MSILGNVLKAFRGGNQTPTQKSIQLSGEGWAGLNEGAGNITRHDIPASDYGYAQAYAVVEAVRACVDIYADMIEQMPYSILRNPSHDPSKDEIIGSSDDIKPRTAIQAALKRYRKQYNINLIRRMVYSTMIYDVSYVELIRDDYQLASDLRWLNPLGVQAYEMNGQIIGYWYNWQNETGKVYFSVDEIAYDHGFNPYDDNAGMSIILSVLNELNVDSQLKSMLRDTFANNSRPGFIASIADPQYQTPEVLAMLDKAFTNYIKGKGNHNKTLLSPVPLNTDTFDTPDLDKNMPVAQSVRAQVFSAFGVPMAMVGDTGSTRYKESLDARAAFVQAKVKPLLIRLQDHFNDVIMLFFDPYGNTRFEFDTSAYDLLTELDQQKANMLLADMNAGIVTIGQVQEMRNYPVDESIKDWYVIEGVPVPRTALSELYRYKFGIAQLESGLQFSNAPSALSVIGNPTSPTPPDATPPANDTTLSLGDTMETDFLVPSKSAVMGTELIMDSDHTHDHLHDHELLHKALFDGIEGLYPDETTITALQSKELEAWLKFEKARIGKSNKRAFSAKYLEPIIYYNVLVRLQSGMTLHKAIIGVLDDETVKTALTYRQRARAIARGVFEGNIGMSAGITQFEDLIAREFESAFYKGLGRGGVNRSDATDDQLATLARETIQEQRNVYDLIDTISQIRRDEGVQSSLQPIRNRIELWVVRLDGIEELGYIVASGTKRLKWRYNTGIVEHCDDCEYLNGKVYTGETWGEINIYPRSSRLKCFGIYCGCGLDETDEPLTKGRPARWS